MVMCIIGVAGIIGAIFLPVWIGWILLLLSVCVVIKVIKAVNRTQYCVWFAVFLIVGFCRVRIGSLWNDNKLQLYKAQDGDQISFEGTVKRVEEKQNSTWLVLKWDGELVLVILPKSKYPEENIYYKGQVYEVNGEIKTFSKPTNPGQFDEAAYYKARGISMKVMAEGFSLQSEGKCAYRWLRILENLRRKEGYFFQNTMSSDGAGVMMAAVLGDRSRFGEEIRTIWQQNGWMHLVTVSGLHLSFIAMGLYRRMRKMTVSIAIASVAALISMMAYGYMTEFGESMIRACIMMTLYLFACVFGRRYDRPTALAFSAFVMLMIRPERIFNSGFALSFLAIIGTFDVIKPGVKNKNPKYASGMEKIKERLKESLMLQTGIFLSTLPVIAKTLYEIPVFGFFYNIFMIPLISIIVPLVFVTGIIGISTGGVIRVAAEQVMLLIDIILNMINRLPAKTYVCGCPKWWQVIIYLMLMILWMMERNRIGKRSMRVRRKICFLLPILATMLLIGVRDDRDRILFLDVGQGDGICFMSRNGETVMLDGGSSDVQSLWRYRIEPALKYYGRDRIDVWLLTHGDTDHTSGIHGALIDSTFRVDRIIMPDTKGSDELTKIQSEAAKAASDIEEIYPYGHIQFGDFSLICLYPNKGTVYIDENDRSMVLSMTHTGTKQSFSALFTGDLGTSGESKIIDVLPVNMTYQLLKVGHHGSKYSTSDEFLNRICARIAVISCGKNNRYGHPHRDTLERLRQANTAILRTDEQGAIEVLFDRDGEALIYGFNDDEMADQTD